MDPKKRKIVYSYIVYYGYAVFTLVIILVLWPFDKTRVGYFFILGGLAGLAMRPLLPEGIIEGRWDTRRRKREMLLSGIAGIVVGIVTLLL